MNIAVFASHGGSDLQAIIDGCKNNKINAEVVVVISNNGDSMALQRAKNEKIPAYHLSAKKSGSEDVLAQEILTVLSQYGVDMIFLAGSMRMLHTSILEKYNNRIFNIHPALLPKFGGKGMFGMNVHTAVVESGEKISGPTVHFVNDKYDEGNIISQSIVVLDEDETPESLSKKVQAVEKIQLTNVLKEFISKNQI